MDLEELLETLPADRMMNVIDAILIDDSLSGAMADGGVESLRTKVLSVYNDSRLLSVRSDSGTDDPMARPVKSAPTYTEQTEDGYVGLEAPFG